MIIIQIEIIIKLTEGEMKNLQVLDAVETLSKLSQINERSHPDRIPQPERIKNAFSTLDTYLQGLYGADQMLLKNHDYLASLKAVMVIASEAYDKLEVVSRIFNKAKEDLGEPEFNHLYDFYLKKINFKVEHVAGEVFRNAEEEQKRALSDTHGIKNLEVIRKDTDYELFYIKDEEGLNHFSKNLLRHTQLLGTFDELFLVFQGEDPFIKLKFIEDRLKQKRALFIKNELSSKVDYFLKEAFRFKKHPFIGLTSQMLVALSLASYPSLVMQNDPSKACFEYFNDFVGFISNLVVRPEFFKTSSDIEALADKGIISSQRFIAGVIDSLFLSKNEIVYVAEHLYQFVKKPIFEGFSPLSFFDKLLEFDKSLRALLMNFPSGPLMKALDFIKDVNKPTIFRPLNAHLPQSLFDIGYHDKVLSCVCMGSPTIQEDIKTAVIDPLFSIFVGHMSQGCNVIIDLEDPSNHNAKARTEALVGLSSDELVTSFIPRSGLLYNMMDIYAFVNNAEEFKALLIEQFASEEGHAYSNSMLFDKDVKDIINFIHETIFMKNKELELKDRLVFVEIFQLFMACALIHKYEASNLIVICKDGLDQSNVYLMGLYALIQMVNHEKLFDQDSFNFFVSEIYGPALIVRDRAVFEDSIVRMLSALSAVQAAVVKNSGFITQIQKILPALKHLKVNRS